MRAPVFPLVMNGLRHRPGETVVRLLLAALLLAGAAWIQVAGQSYRQAVQRALEFSRATMVVTRQGGAPFTQPEIYGLMAMNDVSTALPMLRLHLPDPATGEMVTVSGIDPEVPAVGERTAGLVAGRFLETGETGVALAPAATGLSLDQAVELGGQRFTVVGLYWVPQGTPLESAGLIIPLADARSLYSKQSPAATGAEPLPEYAANLLLVGVIWPEQMESVIGQIQGSLPGAQVFTPDAMLARGSLLAQLARTTPVATGLRWALGGGLILAATAVVRSTAGRSWQQRRRLLAARLALGWPVRELRSHLAAELLLQVLTVAALAAPLAVAGGFLLSLGSAGFPGWPDPVMAIGPAVHLPLPLVLEPGTLALWILGGSLAILYGGWEILSEAARVSPLVALEPEAAATDRALGQAGGRTGDH